MRKQFITLICLLILAAGCQTAADGDQPPTRDPSCEWYACGTLQTATRAEWDSATAANQIATAAAFADVAWLQLFGPNVDYDVVRALPEYEVFVNSIQRCIDSALTAELNVEQVGAECALSVPIIR